MTASEPSDRLPVRMLHDRILVARDGDSGERTSGSGIVIPATARLGRRLSWAKVAAVGQNVRTVEVGDRVLYDPDEKAEVEVGGALFTLVRERDLHAVAAGRLDSDRSDTGLYL